MKYLLDTNLCIYLLKGRRPEALSIARRFKAQDCAVSVVTEFELAVGVARGQRSAGYRALLDGFLGGLHLLPFASEDAQVAAEQRAVLEQAGMMIGPYDLLIAAQALRHGLTLVTNNEREFRRVKSLKVENWSRE